MFLFHKVNGWKGKENKRGENDDMDGGRGAKIALLDLAAVRKRSKVNSGILLAALTAHESEGLNQLITHFSVTRISVNFQVDSEFGIFDFY